MCRYLFARWLGEQWTLFNMVWDIFLKPFLLLSCFIGNSVGEGVMSKNYRFKTFSLAFLEASSVKTDVSDLIRKCTQQVKNYSDWLF